MRIPVNQSRLVDANDVIRDGRHAGSSHCQQNLRGDGAHTVYAGNDTLIGHDDPATAANKQCGATGLHETGPCSLPGENEQLAERILRGILAGNYPVSRAIIPLRPTRWLGRIPPST